MNWNDFIYTQVYKGCLKEGIPENLAKDCAVMTLQSYKNNQFQKPSKLVEQAIKDAKKKFKKAIKK